MRFGLLAGLVRACFAIRVPQATPPHLLSGVPIAAAGVVPYVVRPGLGVHFLLQRGLNGTRAGKLSDFGGRREVCDGDPFDTAARELCEETDYAFGDVEQLATSLRDSSSVRILNRRGRYVCFFLKVDYLPAGMMPRVDSTSEDWQERDLRWYRADELLGSRIGEDGILERIAPPMPNFVESVWTQPTDATQLSTFQKALCKTLTLENAHPHAHERWHSTVLSTLAAAEERRERERESKEALQVALAAAASRTGQQAPLNAKSAALKRGSRRGSSYSKPPSPSWVKHPPGVPVPLQSSQQQRGARGAPREPVLVRRKRRPPAREMTRQVSDQHWTPYEHDEFRP